MTAGAWRVNNSYLFSGNCFQEKLNKFIGNILWQKLNIELFDFIKITFLFLITQF